MGSIPESAFGKAQWARYFGDIGIEPPLPRDIQQTLRAPCPFFPGKTVGESHLLVLIPRTVNGRPLTLTTLEELVKAPREGQATQYRYKWAAFFEEHGNRTTNESHWVLMTRDVIAGSRNKTYAQQQALLGETARRTGIDYEVPTALEAAVCIFMRYMISGKRLFSDSPSTYTRCKEATAGYQGVVGEFSLAGLYVDNFHSSFGNASNGLAALRSLR